MASCRRRGAALLLPPPKTPVFREEEKGRGKEMAAQGRSGGGLGLRPRFVEGKVEQVEEGAARQRRRRPLLPAFPPWTGKATNSARPGGLGCWASREKEKARLSVFPVFPYFFFISVIFFCRD